MYHLPGLQVTCRSAMITLGKTHVASISGDSYLGWLGNVYLIDLQENTIVQDVR